MGCTPIPYYDPWSDNRRDNYRRESGGGCSRCQKFYCIGDAIGAFQLSPKVRLCPMLKTYLAVVDRGYEFGSPGIATGARQNPLGH